jgi:hypothetical protein
MQSIDPDCDVALAPGFDQQYAQLRPGHLRRPEAGVGAAVRMARASTPVSPELVC